MTQHLISVYDLATESYARLFCVSHPAQAVRSFTEEANNHESEICKHAKDYELWILGTMDESTGELSPQRQRLVRAADLKRPTQE